MRFSKEIYNKCRYPKLTKAAEDNVFDLYLFRRISCYLTMIVSILQISPNIVTVISFLTALFTSIAFASQHLIAGILGINLFRTFACVDGEVARLSGGGTLVGDYLDTVADRAGEVVIILGLFFLAADSQGDTYRQFSFLAYISALLVLSTSTEKFRGVFKTAFPRAEFDGALAWFGTGGDGRWIFISIILAVTPLFPSRDLLSPLLNAMTAVMLFASARRAFIVYNRYR